MEKSYVSIMRRSNCSALLPPGRTRGHHFLGLARSFYHLISTLSRTNKSLQSLHFPMPRPFFTLFSSAPSFFIKHIFPLIPGLPGLIVVQQFDGALEYNNFECLLVISVIPSQFISF